MNRYQVHLKSTTYRDVEISAEDEDTAVDKAIASLEGVASDIWIEAAAVEKVEILELSLESLYAWLAEAPGTLLDGNSVDYIQNDDSSISFLNWDGNELLTVGPGDTVIGDTDVMGPYMKIQPIYRDVRYEVRRMFSERAAK
jgi:hypothetical protein